MKHFALISLALLALIGCKKILLLDSYFSVKTVRLISPTNTPLKAVHFISSSVGFIGGNSGEIYKTTNGGTSWTDVSLGVDVTINCIYFLHADTGFVGTEGRLYGTEDGGLTWTYLAIGKFNGIDFGSSAVGYAATGAGFDGGSMYKTYDRGKTWTELAMVSWPSWVSGMYDVDFFDADHGTGVGMGGVYMYTQDGGATWDGYSNGYPGDDDSHAVFQTDKGNSDALIVGDGGEFMGDRVELDLFCIDVSGSRGVAGGDNSVYIKDGSTGGEWEFALTSDGVSFGATIYGVSFSASNVVFAVGGAGEVFKLTLQ